MKRRKKVRRVVPPPKSRAELEREHGMVLTVADLAHQYIVTSIIGNTVVVRRKSDNRVGTLQFQNDRPLYFHFVEAPATEDGQ